MSRERDSYDRGVIKVFRANVGKLLRRIVEQTRSVSATLNRVSRELPVVILDLRTAPTSV
jgi:hypothetical protein